MTTSARDLLRALPTMRGKNGCPEDTLRHPATREPLVAVNGSLADARPATLGVPLDECVLVSLGRLRKLLQAWPKGESVETAHGTFCRLGFLPTHEPRGTVHHCLYLRGGRFEVRLDGPRTVMRTGWHHGRYGEFLDVVIGTTGAAGRGVSDREET